MKRNKLLAVLLSAVLLIVPFAVPVYAGGISSLFSNIDFSSISDILSGIFGGENGGVDLSDLGDLSVLRAKLQEYFQDNDIDLSNISQLVSDFIKSGNFDLSSIGDMRNLLSDEGFLSALEAYISGRRTGETTTEPTTVPTPSTTEPTTIPPATAAPSTEVVTSIVYVYQGAQTYVVPTTTEPPEEMYTYQYVEPATVSVPEITTQVFQPVEVEEYTPTEEKSDGFSVKSVIGIALLVLSLAAVVVVAVILKKNKV